MVKAVVLAAGLGTRMRPYTLFVPKPMLPLGEKPVLEHLIEWLKKHNIEEIAICVGYLRRIIEDYFGDGSEHGVGITYIKTLKPMGTAGQLKSASGFVDGRFICIYGDSIFDFDLNHLLKVHVDRKALATIALKHYEFASRYGFIDVDGSGRVTKWREKPKFRGTINIGCYVMEPRFLDYIPSNVMFGMDEAIKRSLEADEPVYGVKVKGDFTDIGDRRAYAKAYEQYLSRLGRIA